MKQVIVVRKDLNMRKGKIASQVAHASMGAILPYMRLENSRPDHETRLIPAYWWDHLAYVEAWLEGSFVKICVSVNSEAELLVLEQEAKGRGLPHCLIKDNGTTEFKGVPTYTALAVGPAPDDLVNLITGNLPLL